MRNMLGVLSTILFLVGLSIYLLTLFGYDQYLRIGVILSCIGFLLSLIASRSIYQKVGSFGNGVIIFFAILLPLAVTTFLWNQP